MDYDDLWTDLWTTMIYGVHKDDLWTMMIYGL
jgi:hypothetical protein